VCVIGKRSGFMPPPAAAEPFADILPPGIGKASYTQWEFFFARHFHRRLSIYIATDEYQPDAHEWPNTDDSGLQQAFLNYIVREQGLDRNYFSNEDQLCRAVLREDWPKKVQLKPIALPYPSLGSLFKGRDEFLADLHNSLNRGIGRMAIVGSALYGLGGVGKTRAAVEYAWAHQEDYSALLFVIAETPAALRRNLAALVDPLVLGLPEHSATEEQVRLKAVLDWLRGHPGWLLILDNLDMSDTLAEADSLLGKLDCGRVIITSRLSNFAGHFDALELNVLGRADAVAFLLERTDKRRQKTPGDAEEARQLAVDLGELALALEQAGAYIAKLGLGFARYRQLWQENWTKVAGWADEAITKYPRAVAATWQTSVNQLSDEGRHLLERLAWLAPDPVPNFLLEEQVPEIATEDLEDALADLVTYSLARRNPQKREFTVHRLVQDVTRRSLSGDKRTRSLVEALALINAAWPSGADDVRSWPQAEALAPHAQAATEHAATAGIFDLTATLMNHLGLLLRAKALYGDAESLYRRALAIDEKSSGPDHPIVAIHLNNLAELLQVTNRRSEAEPLCRRALAIDERSYPADHPQVAISLNNLAELLRSTNRLSEAEPLFRRALSINERSYGFDHPKIAASLNNLAGLLQESNRPSEAESLYRRALAIAEKKYDPDHREVAICLGSLAFLLRVTNRLSEAEPLYRRALKIFETSYGPDHPDVANRLNNLAELLRATNRPSEADPLYRRALRINEKSYGPNHPKVAMCLNNLAGLMLDINRLNDAEPLYRRALAINEKSWGPDHPEVATSLNNLAVLLMDTDRRSEAEPLLRRALAIDESSYGPEHPRVATDLNNLAGLLRARNRRSDAEPLYRRALAISERSNGRDHPSVAIRLNNLASLLWEMRRLSEAEPLFRRALAIDEKSYGPDHPNVATGLNNLAALLRDTHRLSEAKRLYRRALKILVQFTRTTGHQHPNFESACVNYARVLTELGRSKAKVDAALQSVLQGIPSNTASR